ncbi:MAG TPA: hypothetical protein DD490_10025 [Acidobacteria bacterium]|nr:hypothetical protein [Acidobacteriota bacterium]
MRPESKGMHSMARLIPFAVLCAVLLHAPVAAAQTMYMVGTVSGTVNGRAVDFDLNIEMNMETGEETATVGRMDPEMGAILRQVTALVTVAGPTGGSTPQGGENLFELSGGNFVNSASMYWPRTNDRLELIHRVSYSGGDTMAVTATINGTVPVISGEDAVTFKDFSEIMYWDGPAGACATCKATAGAQSVTTGVGFEGDFRNAKFRSYQVGDVQVDEEVGKGSTTTYHGPNPGGPVTRSARDIRVSYDPGARTMNVHLFNTLTPLEAAPAASR